MSDTLDLIPFTQLAGKLPGQRPGKRLHPAALHRWRLEGLKAPDGTRVRLAAEKIGGRWCTTWAHVMEFFALLNQEQAPAPDLPGRRELKRRQEAAAKRLEELGVR